MSDRKRLLLAYLQNSKIALKELRKQSYSFLNSSFIWQILIYEFEHWDNPTEVLIHNFSAEDIIHHIKTYVDLNGLPIKKITVKHSFIPGELNNELIKAKVKFKGEIWIIHKNDKDTFPSQPHAHNYSRQYKLHLGNGKLFRKNDCIGNITNKDLLHLRKLIKEKIRISLPVYEAL